MKKILLGLVAIVVLIQLVPVDRTNPESDAALEIESPADVQAILENSCYDCHSNKTIWPWYSYVAPVSWLVARDVDHGRKHYNFSEWHTYSEEKQEKIKEEIWDEVFEGNMPLPIYLNMHSDAALSDEQKQTIKAWALQEEIKTDSTNAESEEE